VRGDGAVHIERRRVLVLLHPGKRAAVEMLTELAPWLEERFEHVAIVSDVLSFAERHRASRTGTGTSDALPDLVVVLGGDGAMLSAVRAFRDAPVPTLGINFGRVGFLASTPQSRWRDVLTGVLEGRGVLEPRMRLSLSIADQNLVGVALNDVVLSRSPEDAMLRLSLDVDGAWVTNYRADGLILATPSGSTAYALSAGGPILAPSMLGVVVAPICSQALANRPLVLHPDSQVLVRVTAAESDADVVLDGRRFARVKSGATLAVTRHPLPFPLLSMPELDPYRRLRERLGWNGGDGLDALPE
jgi:NAD+ kinase